MMMTGARYFLPLVFLLVACGGSDDAPAATLSAPVLTPTSGAPFSGSGTPLATLSGPELRGLVDPGIRAAVEDLRQRIEGDLNRLGILRAERATWENSSLGCREPGGSYDQALTEGLWLVLSYEGRDYDYRISGLQARLCVSDDEQGPLGRRSLEGLWSRLASMPTPRGEVAAVELEGKLYVFGGFGRGAVANEAYDPATDTWRRLAPIPRGVDHPGAVASAGKIYLIGGFDGRFGPIGHVWAYDPVADSWARKADLPSPRGALGAAAVGGVIYAIGGVAPGGDVGTNEAYDPAGDRWSSRSPMPTARDHVTTAVVNDRIYVVGGRLGNMARNLDRNEQYDPGSDSWASKPALPTARSGIAAAVVEGTLYVFGDERPRSTFDTNESYAPGGSWDEGPPMPTARHGHGAVALGNRIYVLAGGPEPGGSESALNEVFIVLGRPLRR